MSNPTKPTSSAVHILNATSTGLRRLGVGPVEIEDAICIGIRDLDRCFALPGDEALNLAFSIAEVTVEKTDSIDLATLERLIARLDSLRSSMVELIDNGSTHEAHPPATARIQ